MNQSFHEERKTGLGGSDAPSVLRVSKWASATPLEVYMAKKGLTEPGEDSEPAEWGRILEPVVLRQYAMRNDCEVLGRNEMGQTCVFLSDGDQTFCPAELEPLMEMLRHPIHEFMVAHIDGLVIEHDDEGWRVVKGIDAKTTSAYLSDNWEDGDMPVEYAVQVHHYSIVLEGHLGYFVGFDIPVLIGGQRWECPTLEYDADLANQMIQLEGDFWRNHIEADEPPPAEPTDNVGRLYPSETEGETLDAEPNSELEQGAYRLKKASDAQKRAEKDEDAAKNYLKERMKTAERINGVGWSATWKSYEKKTVDWEAIVRKMDEEIQDELAHGGVTPCTGLGELIAEHTAEQTIRAFRPSVKGLKL